MFQLRMNFIVSSRELRLQADHVSPILYELFDTSAVYLSYD